MDKQEEGSNRARRGETERGRESRRAAEGGKQAGRQAKRKRRRKILGY